MERLKAEAVNAVDDHQAELLHLEENEKEATAKDARLKVAIEKDAELEKALEACNCAGDLERHGTLLEAQHLEESFSSKCFSWILPGWNHGFLSLVIFLTCSFSSQGLGPRPSRRRVS